MSRPVARTRWPSRSRPAIQPLYGNGVVPITADRNHAVVRALKCAERGWPVFPCRAGTKEPATTHGFDDATTDPDQIRAWWDRWPGANLAIATGAPGPDVLDVDHGRVDPWCSGWTGLGHCAGRGGRAGRARPAGG
jgi:hypothetical protein